MSETSLLISVEKKKTKGHHQKSIRWVCCTWF